MIPHLSESEKLCSAIVVDGRVGYNTFPCASDGGNTWCETYSSNETLEECYDNGIFTYRLIS